MSELLIPATHLGEMQARLSTLEAEARHWRGQTSFLREAIQELETEIAREGFQRLGGIGTDARNFSRDALRTITRESFLFWLRNPLIRRGVDVISDYVWGQGININTGDEKVEQTVSDFMALPHNQVNLFGHQARVQRDQDLSVNGNVFFVFFTNPSTGTVRLSDLPFDEIDDKICNPQDSSEPWYYRRKWTATRIDQSSGRLVPQQLEAFYPDIDYRPLPADRPERIGEVDIRWDTPLMHVSDGGASSMKFAAPITFPVLHWARSYNLYLENWIKLVKSLARFAWDVPTSGGQAGVDAVKNAVHTSITETNANEGNPSPTTGAAWIHGGSSQQWVPIKTQGVTMSLEEGRRILLMVASGLGLPESFFGDVSVGTLATAQSLDRPTELRMKRRQGIWKQVYEAAGNYAMEQSARATSGMLRGLGAPAEDLIRRREEWQWSENLDTTLGANFPNILERDMESEVRAWATGATANGAPIQGMDLRTYAAGVFAALRVPDPQRKAEDLFPEGSEPAPQVTAAEAKLADAVRNMHESLKSAGYLNGQA